MAFVVQAHIDDHTLSATTETAKEAFAKAVEWQVVHKLSCVIISDGVRSFTITDFASAMAFLEIAKTVCAMSDRRPKVQE
jgi:pterin-4a-carbinolamine dehydratase